MARKLSTDLVLLGTTLALFGFGLVMVWSASSALAQERHGSPYYFLLKQVAWGTLGLIALVLALRLDYKTLRRPVVVYPLLIVSTLLLIVVLFLPSVNGTHRWIRLGRAELPARGARQAVARAVPRLPHRAPRRAHQRARDPLPRAAARLVVRLPDPDPAGPRHRVLHGAHLRRRAVRRRRQAQVLRSARGAGAAGALRRRDGRALAARALRELLQPVGGSPGRGLPRDPEPDRGGAGRRHRRRPDGRPPEALLPAVSVQRLRVRGDRRGAGPASARSRW